MYTIGIDVGGTNLKAGLVNEAFEIVDAKKMPLVWESPEKFAGDLCALATALVEKNGISRDQVQYIGMGVPGVVDVNKGTIVKTVNIPIRNMPVAEMIQRSWDIPVYLGNDADCAALGEFYHFANKDIESLILVTLGTGVGTGIILNGKILRGFNGCAGEGGHMVIVSDGEQCTCGRRGCWERYASASGLIRLTRIAMEQNRSSAMWHVAEGRLEQVDGRTAFTAAREGDDAAKEVVDQYLTYLAEGITNLVNLLQPEVVCIGGGVSNEADEALLFPLQKKVEALRYDKDADRHTLLAKAHLGNDAGIIGAALLGRE